MKQAVPRWKTETVLTPPNLSEQNRGFATNVRISKRKDHLHLLRDQDFDLSRYWFGKFINEVRLLRHAQYQASLLRCCQLCLFFAKLAITQRISLQSVHFWRKMYLRSLQRSDQKIGITSQAESHHRKEVDATTAVTDSEVDENRHPNLKETITSPALSWMRFHFRKTTMWGSQDECPRRKNSSKHRMEKTSTSAVYTRKWGTTRTRKLCKPDEAPKRDNFLLLATLPLASYKKRRYSSSTCSSVRYITLPSNGMGYCL